MANMCCRPKSNKVMVVINDVWLTGSFWRYWSCGYAPTSVHLTMKDQKATSHLASV